MEEAQEVHRIEAIRFWQRQMRWLPALLFLLALAVAQSAVAAPLDDNTLSQEPSNPTTVVLPDLQIRFPYILGQAQNVVGCPTTSSRSYESIGVNQQREHEPAPPLDP